MEIGSSQMVIWENGESELSGHPGVSEWTGVYWPFWCLECLNWSDQMYQLLQSWWLIRQTGVCDQTGVSGQTGVSDQTGMSVQTGVSVQTGMSGQTEVSWFTGAFRTDWNVCTD